MTAFHCPVCRNVNRPSARRCEVCGARLGDGDTVPSPLRPVLDAGVDSDFAVSALWFDDLPRTAGTTRPHAGAAPAPDITLHEPHPIATAGLQPGPAVEAANPDPPVAIAAAAAAAAPAALPVDRAARRAVKVARRAAVRRSRLASAPPPAVCDVLVMAADAPTRHHLDELLAAFGFRVRPVATLSQAALLAAHHPFAAVFVALPPGDIDAEVHTLFDQARDTSRLADGQVAVRVLVAATWRPMDRVRAELAGCDATLSLPVDRRDIARVLDANGVVLPKDPRRV